MATLEELRERLRNPKEKREPKPPATLSPVVHRYKINTDGDDAILLFGKFSGKLVSQMVRASRSKRYLKWLLRQDNFPDDLKNVVRHNLSSKGG